MPTDHAILAPSAAKRWMTCAPSARLEAQVPNKETSYTREGTIAHGMAEELLRIHIRENHLSYHSDFPELFKTAYEAIHRGKGGVMAGDEENILCLRVEEALAEGLDPWEMMETVSENYCRIVYEDYLQAKAEDPDAILLVEQKLKLAEYIPEGFGSSDAVIIWGSTLAVYDLKYGKGVKVSARNNAQMKCYALGAILGPGELYDLAQIRMTIIQPRLEWVSTDESTYWDILKWASEDLRPAAILAYQGGGDFVPGEHCRFCNIAPRCKALAAQAASLNINLKDTALMTNEEIAEAIRSAANLKSWIAGLESYALQKALEGESFPGLKVVEGKSNRQISDPAAAMQLLEDAGFDESSYIRPKELKTITDLERLLRKDGFKQLLGKLVTKPQGKPALVDESDPRPVFNSAKEDFKDIAL